MVRSNQNMTVQELFRNIGFEAIVKALQNTRRNDESIQQTALYKEAFDTLVTLTPSNKGGRITFDITPREHWFDKHCPLMLANNVEGDIWEDIVGREVIKPDGNPFTEAELAGAILWGATFYGFTSHHMWNPYDKIFTKYGDKAKWLERKLYKPYIRDKQELKQLESGDMRFGIAFSMETWNQIYYRQKHQNRQKRKRFYRLEQQIKRLKKLDKRHYLISQIEQKTGSKLENLADKILNAGSITEDWRESHICEDLNRVDYLIDLLSNYQPDVSHILNEGAEALVIIYTSSEYAITPDEDKKLEAFLNALCLNTILHIRKGTDNTMDKEMGIQFIVVSEKEVLDEKIQLSDLRFQIEVQNMMRNLQ